MRKDTFFEKSHLSIYCIVVFAYLWIENDVFLTFIKNQIEIVQQSAVGGAYFHREVVFDGMILRHEKIGNVFFVKKQKIMIFLKLFITFIMKVVLAKLLKSTSFLHH